MLPSAIERLVVCSCMQTDIWKIYMHAHSQLHFAIYKRKGSHSFAMFCMDMGFLFCHLTLEALVFDAHYLEDDLFLQLGSIY
jgi:hypothetical protein